MTHGVGNIKIITTQQAKFTHNYKNNKLKLLKCNAFLWFNRQCKINNLTPKYAHFNTRSQNDRAGKTKSVAINYRANQEIKFHYNKKQHLNVSLHETQLECAEFWKSLCPTLQEKTEHKISCIMENTYNGLHKKKRKTKTKQRTNYETMGNRTTTTTLSPSRLKPIKYKHHARRRKGGTGKRSLLRNN
jgi:hypothetical protein